MAEKAASDERGAAFEQSALEEARRMESSGLSWRERIRLIVLGGGLAGEDTQPGLYNESVEREITDEHPIVKPKSAHQNTSHTPDEAIRMASEVHDRPLS